MSEKTERWIMCRDGVGNIWVGATYDTITSETITYHESYQVVRFSGSHKGLLGLALVGPDEEARIVGGAVPLSIRRIEWACQVSPEAIPRIRAQPWMK